MSNYLLAAKVLESSGRHPEALASILDATPACATFSLPITITILLPPRRGMDLRWFGWQCTEGATLPSRVRLETSKDGTDYEEHQSVEVSARRELHCVRPVGPRVNFLRVTLEGDGECCLAELTLFDRRPVDEAAAPAPAPAPAATAAPRRRLAAAAAAAAAAGPSDDVLWTVAQLGDHVQRCAAAVTTPQRQLAASRAAGAGDARRAAEAEAAAARERAHWDEKAHVERWESRVVDEVLLPQLRDMLDLLRRQQRREDAAREAAAAAPPLARVDLSAATAAAPAAAPPAARRGHLCLRTRRAACRKTRRCADSASRFESGSSARPTCCATTRARSGVRRSRRDYCIHL